MIYVLDMLGNNIRSQELPAVRISVVTYCFTFNDFTNLLHKLEKLIRIVMHIHMLMTTSCNIFSW